MKLGIVLARRDAVTFASALTRAALAAGDEVAWFVMDEALFALAERAATEVLPLDGLELTVCATSLDRIGAAAPRGARVGSQDDHAALVRWADKLVALT